MWKIILLVMVVGVVYIARKEWKRFAKVAESHDELDQEKLREKEVDLKTEAALQREDNDTLWEEVDDMNHKNKPRRNTK